MIPKFDSCHHPIALLAPSTNWGFHWLPFCVSANRDSPLQGRSFKVGVRGVHALAERERSSMSCSIGKTISIVSLITFSFTVRPKELGQTEVVLAKRKSKFITCASYPLISNFLQKANILPSCKYSFESMCEAK